jgi:hypothetical protein
MNLKIEKKKKIYLEIKGLLYEEEEKARPSRAKEKLWLLYL